jgi:hypothetical protein
MKTDEVICLKPVQPPWLQDRAPVPGGYAGIHLDQYLQIYMINWGLIKKTPESPTPKQRPQDGHC